MCLLNNTFFIELFKMKKLLLLLSGLLFSVAVNAQIVPQNGLVAYYPFNGNSLDSTANNYNLTVYNGAQLCADRFGKANRAYQFDGIDDYLALGFPLPQGQNFSVSAWYSASNNHQRSVIFHNGFGNGDGVGIGQAAGTMGVNNTLPGDRIVLYTGGINYYAEKQTDTGIWHHIVITAAGTSYKYYFDDVVIASGTWSIYSPTTEFAVGYSITTTDAAFQGKIDDIAWYNRTLTALEVDTLFNSCTPQIASGPVNASVPGGSTATFSVSSNSTIATYQWQMDGGTGYANLTNAGPFSGTTTNTLTVSNVTSILNNNNFRVVVTGDVICKDTSLPARLTVWPTSVPNVEASNPISVYPNPSSGKITINGQSLVPGRSYLLKIENLLGQIVILKEITGSELDKHVLEIGRSGVFFVTLTEQQGRLAGRAKVIIQ